MKIAKWLGIVVLALVVLIIGAAVVATRFIDAQQFKPQIAATVRDATGRELQLRGPLRLSWFPWLALQANDGALIDHPGAEPMLSWRQLRIGARALPLLGGKLSLDRVQIDGAQIHLARNAAGVGNWQPLLEKLRAPGGSSDFALSEIAGISLRDATLEYRSADGKRLQLTKLNLDTSKIEAGKPIALHAAFDFSPAEDTAGPSIVFNAVATLQGDVLALRNVEAVATAGAAANADNMLQLALKAPALKAKFGTQLWQLPVATLTMGTAAAQLTEASLQLTDAGMIGSAKFALVPTSLRALLLGAGIKTPATRDPRALSVFAAAGSLDYSPTGLRVNLASLQIDTTKITGQLSLLTTDDVNEFTLAGDAMDLDRYRNPPDGHSEPLVFPTKQLAALRARGTLTLQQAQSAGADLRGVTLRLLFANGQAQSVTAEKMATSTPTPPHAPKPAANSSKRGAAAR